MMRTDIYGLPPGLSVAAETYEAAFRWGQFGVGIITGAIIDGAAIDSGNSPTYELRPGLLLGKVMSTGKYINYGATNTDGSGVAAGVLMSSMRMQDFQGTNQQRFFGILVGGPIQGAKILGLDGQARAQMAAHFQFDDDLPGRQWFPWKQQHTITTSYAALSTDNMTLFNNLGAGGAVILTLPAIANGYVFGISVQADQNMTIASFEGDNIVAFNDASADSVAFSTGGQLLGGLLKVYSNPAGTKWIAENLSAGTNTVTVAT